MSDKALITRINRISNVDKLQDFLLLLEEEGKDELAAHARSKLATMV